MLEPGAFQPGVLRLHAVGVAAGGNFGPGIAPDNHGRRRRLLAFPGIGQFRAQILGRGDNGPLVTDVSDFHAQGKAHGLEPCGQSGSFRCFGDEPRGGSVIHGVGSELDPTLDAEEHGFGALTGLETREYLAGERGEPIEAISAGHGHHAALRLVHVPGSARQARCSGTGSP